MRLVDLNIWLVLIFINIVVCTIEFVKLRHSNRHCQCVFLLNFHLKKLQQIPFWSNSTYILLCSATKRVFRFKVVYGMNPILRKEKGKKKRSVQSLDWNRSLPKLSNIMIAHYQAKITSPLFSNQIKIIRRINSTIKLNPQKKKPPQSARGSTSVIRVIYELTSGLFVGHPALCEQSKLLH